MNLFFNKKSRIFQYAIRFHNREILLTGLPGQEYYRGEIFPVSELAD
jgi:hypothetical protein